MIDTEALKNSVIYPFTNFAIVITGQNASAGQTFSSKFQSVKEAVCEMDNITHIQLSVSSETVADATGAISVNDITKCSENISHISYTIFRTDALFLTPDTVNGSYEISSVIVGVRANGTPVCSGMPLTISLQPIREVSCFDYCYNYCVIHSYLYHVEL